MQGSHMQKRQTTSPFGCPPSTGRSVSSALSILRLLEGGGPSKPSAITSKLLSERMVSSKNDSIVSLSVWKNIILYGNTNRHLAIRACNIRETSKRTLDLYFLFFTALYAQIIVCVPFWHNCMVFRCFYQRRKKPPLEELLRGSKCVLNQLFDVGSTTPFILPRKLAVCTRVGSSVFVPYAFK